MKKEILKFKKGDRLSVDDLVYPLSNSDRSFVNFNSITNKIDSMGDDLICLRDIKITIKYDDKVDLDKETEKQKVALEVDKV